MRPRRLTGALPAILAAIAFPAAPQIITDGSVGARVTLSGAGANIAIPETLGLRVSGNLLHSFSDFNVRQNETASFVGLGGIVNVIARVTGGTASTIEGNLRSSITGTNLYLINPGGVIFGPTATISVPGSFYASTAHYLRLADGTRIEMRASPGVTLTAAPPAAFGFEGATGAIALTGAQLRVPEGRRIGLAGGDVTMGAAANGRTSLLSAPSGAIGVVAASSAGEAVIVPEGLRAEGFTAMGRLTIQGRSLVSVNEAAGRLGGGAISLTAGMVAIDHANVESRTAFVGGRGISVIGTDSISVNAGNVLSVTRGAGNAGPLRLEGGDITLSGGALVDTSCDPGCTTGSGGALTVVAGRSLTLLGDDAAAPTYLVSNSFGGGRTGAIDIRSGSLLASGNAFIQGIATAASTGDGTSITIASDTIALTGGAQVDVSTRGTGHGGTLTVSNTGSIRIEGTRIADAVAGVKAPSGFFSNTEASGAAGAIVVSTASLEVLGGGEISSSARPRSTGDGGRIEITAGALRVAGTDGDFKSSGIVTNTFGSGKAGDIVIAARTIAIADEGRIQVQSEGAGHAGSARLVADSMTLTGRGQVSSDARSTGDGGTIDAEVAGTLSISGFDSGLFAKTYGPASGGAIAVRAGEIVMSDRGGIFAGTDGRGRGGDIAVDATGAVDIGDRARITVESRAQGDAGSIVIAAGGLDVHDGGMITAESSSIGNGGSVTITTPGRLALQRGGRITVESLSTGLAGTIRVEAGEAIHLLDGARITTQALQADGGDIFVSAGRIATVGSSEITTAVSTGQGSGGNITVRVPTLLLGNSVISANAFGGDGGNIRIGTTTFVPSANSKVTASSTLGIDGTITFESPALDPTGELLVPPPAFVDAGSVLAGRCGPRLAGRASSLVVAPRVGIAEAPDGWRLQALGSAPSWARPLACIAAVPLT